MYGYVCVRLSRVAGHLTDLSHSFLNQHNDFQSLILRHKFPVNRLLVRKYYIYILQNRDIVVSLATINQLREPGQFITTICLMKEIYFWNLVI